MGRFHSHWDELFFGYYIRGYSFNKLANVENAHRIFQSPVGLVVVTPCIVVVEIGEWEGEGAGEGVGEGVLVGEMEGELVVATPCIVVVEIGFKTPSRPTLFFRYVWKFPKP